MFVVAAWLLTYLVHSSVLLSGAALIARWRRHVGEQAWRAAMFGGIGTSVAQAWWLRSHSDAFAFSTGVPSVLPNALSSLLPLVLATWIGIASVRVYGLIRAHQTLARLLADRTLVVSPMVGARVQALSGPRHVSVSTSAFIQTPMVVGWSELCLPVRAMTELSMAEMETVLAHEFAHLRRRDRLWLTLAAIVERALFVQPLNRVAAHQMRELAEYACDDWALRRIDMPLALASALAQVAGWLACAPITPFAIGMASCESLALARVRRILDPSAERLGRPRRPHDIIVVAITLVSVVVAAPGFTPQLLHHTIEARDAAGPFTLSFERDSVVGMTIDGVPVQSSQARRDGNRIRVVGARNEAVLDLALTPRGGIRWTSRPVRVAAAP